MTAGAEYDARCLGYRREAEAWYALLHGARFAHVYEYLWRARLLSDGINQAAQALATKVEGSVLQELDKLGDVTPGERKLVLAIAADIVRLTIAAANGEDVAYARVQADAALLSLRSAAAQSVAAGVNRVLGALATGALEGLGAVAAGLLGGAGGGVLPAGLLAAARRLIGKAGPAAAGVIATAPEAADPGPREPHL